MIILAVQSLRDVRSPLRYLRNSCDSIKQLSEPHQSHIAPPYRSFFLVNSLPKVESALLALRTMRRPLQRVNKDVDRFSILSSNPED